MFDACVLGVDPGLARMGLAVVIRDGRGQRLAWAATVRTPDDVAQAARLAMLVEAVRRAIDAHRPTALALERVAFNRNQVSALSVARATGAVMVAAAEAGLEVGEYGPTEVKAAVTGTGSADKAQVRDALVRIHGLRSAPADPDAADAVAVALTHLTGSRLRAAARTGAP